MVFFPEFGFIKSYSMIQDRRRSSEYVRIDEIHFMHIKRRMSSIKQALYGTCSTKPRLRKANYYYRYVTLDLDQNIVQVVSKRRQYN